MMKPSSSGNGRAQFSSFSSTSVTYTFKNEEPVSNLQTKIKKTIPVYSSEELKTSASAVKIQSAYRSYVVRGLVKKIHKVNSQANYWEKFIQSQDTVDAVRSNEREKIRINEALMGLLFQLDSVPGFNPTIKELRRHVSRRIVGLQEIIDAIADIRVKNWDGYVRDWDDILSGIEKEACYERYGGYEINNLCADHLGFERLRRFLQDQ